ncbi:glycosyltransferase [Streptomyces sp900105245]|uniref:glycosyltransferase n=1 Tax=Streptomyces sp. 900105245 TaxID=3154379 RepID=UPI003330F90F
MTTCEVFGWENGSAGGYYRVQLPMRSLAGLGHAVAGGTALPADWLRDHPDMIVVGQRVLEPRASRLWQEMAAAGRRLIFEIDDDLWNVDRSSPFFHGLMQREDVRENLRRNIEVAHAVTVTTEPLADRVRTINPRVHVIPNAVPDWLLDHRPARRTDGIITVGWGGDGTHAMDWEDHAEPIRGFFSRHPHTEMHCMGADYDLGLTPEGRTRFTPWIQGVEPYLHAVDYHIGIAPLRKHVFNHSKSALRTLEYAALGIPVVASAVGPYARHVREEVTGYLVRRPHEWDGFLNVLANDADLRDRMGAAAREHASAHASSRVAPLWEKAVFG